MILQAWGSAAVLVAASALVGHAINLLGARSRAVAPAVGLSLLVIVAYAALRLPGRATTAVVAVAVVIVAAGAVVVVRMRAERRQAERREPHGRRALAVPVATAVTIALAAFGAALPFIANGRIGLPGVSFDNDTAPHLIWAQALQQPVVGDRYGLNLGYPLGPHSLVAVISRGLGVRLDLAFTALLIATVIITAIVAASALKGEAAWKRPVVGVLAALFYLVAAYYGEGAFKEPLMGLLLLAMVLQFEAIRDLWSAPARTRFPALLPLAVMVAAGVYVYSYLAFAWFGLTIVIWLPAELVSRPWLLRDLRPTRAAGRWREHRTAVAGQVVPLAVAVVVMLVLLVPIAGRVISYLQSLGLSPAGSGEITVSNLGNLAHPLSAYEGLGIWQNPDFRFLGADIFHQGELSALALGVLVLGLARSIGRRELLLPAAVIACAIIFWHSNQGQSPYVTAKALVIAGPVVAVTGLRGVLRAETIPVSPLAKVGRWVLGIAFVVFAVHSSYQVLRNEPVWPNESTRELIALDKVTSGQPLLFLGNSDYAPWLFHDSEMSALASNTISLARAAARPKKPFAYGTALDFDSVDPTTINQFAWVITSNTTYASQPPAAFRLVRTLPMYQLWQRTGTVSAARQVLEPSGAPGTVLNCRRPLVRALSRRPGVAAVMAAPVSVGLGALKPGVSEAAELRLPAGQWNLSLQYTSPVTLSLRAGAGRWAMPAYADRPGPVFAVGSVTSTGAPMTLSVHASRPSVLSGSNLVAFISTLYATRSPDTRTVVPLSRACGRYVDWYRLSS